VTVFWSEAVKVLDLEILIIKLFTSILEHYVAVSDTRTQLHCRPSHRLELGELYTNIYMNTIMLARYWKLSYWNP
jgi:hypothetical protein